MSVVRVMAVAAVMAAAQMASAQSRTFDVTVARHSTVTTLGSNLTTRNARVSAILTRASLLLQTDDGDRDVAVPVTFQRNGDVKVMSGGNNGVVDTDARLNQYF